MNSKSLRFKTSSILLLILILLCACGCSAKEETPVVTATPETAVPVEESDEQRAEQLLAEGQYEEAYALFSASGQEERIAESKYQRALAFYESGDYEQACELFTGLSYQDSEAYLSLISAKEAYNDISSCRKGDTVLFGTYEQDGDTDNGKEPIEWLVLDAQENQILLLSLYGLDCVDYEPSESNPITWEESSIRCWLNSDFYDASFIDNEKLLIASVNTSADPYTLAEEDSDGDKVFLLSETEANFYLPGDSSKQCVCTQYARDNGSWRTPQNVCRWWLRSDGSSGIRKAGVRHQGSIYSAGFYVDIGYLTVRPVICISNPD